MSHGEKGTDDENCSLGLMLALLKFCVVSALVKQ